MKGQCFRILILIAFFSNTYAQNNAAEQSNKYLMWIDYINQNASEKGSLVEMKEEGIYFISGKTLNSRIVGVPEIDVLRFRKKGKLRNGTLYGGLSGGLLVGLAATTAGGGCSGLGCASYGAEGFLVGFILGALPGMGIGAIMSKGKIIIPLNGSYIKYKEAKSELKKYLIKL